MRRQLKHRAAVGIATLALAATATACGDDGTSGSGSEGDGTGEITFWDNNGGTRTPIWNEIIDAFEKEHPDIDVTYEGVPIDQVQSKYDSAIQGGAGLPDVGMVSTSYLANLVAQGALAPIHDRLADSPLREQLVPAFVDSVRATTGGGEEMYSVPTSANQGILWYRTDLFEEADLEPPTTWENFYTAAEELTDQDNNRFGFTIRGGEGSLAQALDAMYSQSGIDSFWNEDETESTVNAPENVAALERYVELYNTDTPEADLNNDSTGMIATFTGGDIGMIQHNLGSYADMTGAFGEDVAGLPMPTNDSGHHTFVSNPVDGMALFNSSDNKEAAWTFMEFAASYEMNSKWNESAGQIPANTQAQGDPWVAESPATEAAIQALTDENTTIVQLPYYLPDWNNISKADNEPNFQKVLLGDMSAQDFLDDLAEQFNTAQAEWQEQQQ